MKKLSYIWSDLSSDSICHFASWAFIIFFLLSFLTFFNFSFDLDFTWKKDEKVTRFGAWRVFTFVRLQTLWNGHLLIKSWTLQLQLMRQMFHFYFIIFSVEIPCILSFLTNVIKEIKYGHIDQWSLLLSSETRKTTRKNYSHKSIILYIPYCNLTRPLESCFSYLRKILSFLWHFRIWNHSNRWYCMWYFSHSSYFVSAKKICFKKN